MKTLDEYMKMPYRMEVIPDADEGGYAVKFPDLKGCLTCADTLEKALANAEDAKREWFVSAIEDGVKIPDPSEIDSYSGQFRIRMPKSLHHSLAENARREGVSMNQYCIYLLAKHDMSHI